VNEMKFRVPTVSCAHCQVAIEGEVSKVAGVTSVVVDLTDKVVTIEGSTLNVDELLAAIDEAGYDAELID
jgi:copper chaperone